MDFNSIKNLIILTIAMLTVAVIAVVTVVKTGNFEHVVQTVISAAITLFGAFAIAKTVKKNGENKKNS